MLAVVIDKLPRTYDQMAREINQEHALAEEAHGTLLRHAEQAGIILLEMKQRIGHGFFTQWVQNNCKFCERTAVNYMKLAKNKSQIIEAAKEEGISLNELSIRGALRLAKKKEPKQLTLDAVATAIEEEPVSIDINSHEKNNGRFNIGQQVRVKKSGEIGKITILGNRSARIVLLSGWIDLWFEDIELLPTEETEETKKPTLTIFSDDGQDFCITEIESTELDEDLTLSDRNIADLLRENENLREVIKQLEGYLTDTEDQISSLKSYADSLGREIKDLRRGQQEEKLSQIDAKEIVGLLDRFIELQIENCNQGKNKKPFNRKDTAFSKFNEFSRMVRSGELWQE